MKKYEDFNNMFDTDLTAEEQAAGMIVAKIADEYNLDIDFADTYVRAFKAYVNWLNEEVEK